MPREHLVELCEKFTCAGSGMDFQKLNACALQGAFLDDIATRSILAQIMAAALIFHGDGGAAKMINNQKINALAVERAESALAFPLRAIIAAGANESSQADFRQKPEFGLAAFQMILKRAENPERFLVDRAFGEKLDFLNKAQLIFRVAEIIPFEFRAPSQLLNLHQQVNESGSGQES